MIRCLLAVAGCFIVAGCAGPGASPSSGMVRSTWDPAVKNLELATPFRYACGTFSFEPAFLDAPGHAEAGNDAIAAALRTHLAKPDIDIDWLPKTGWLLAGADDHRAEFVAGGPDGVVTVSLENGPDGWKVMGWGQCTPTLALPAGLGTAVWLPSQAKPSPDAQSTTFGVLVTERACASAASSEGRIVGPVIQFDDQRVLVAYAVIPQAGDAFNCLSNPATALDLDLGQLLGDRQLIDASMLPWVDVRTVDPTGY